MVTPSMLLPDLVNDRGVVSLEDGHRKVLIDRMRLITYQDGSIERATELLPAGGISSIALPSRLGSGYIFQSSSGGSTQLWRSPTWLGKLRPLVQLSAVASELIPGFDRLYVRVGSNNKLTAIDPESGQTRSLAPLPPAAAYGVLAFVDGWRAVVDTDLRGPLATFDAGATWRPVGVRERVTAIPTVHGDPTILVANGQYRVDSRGSVTFRTEAPQAGEPQDSEEPAGRPAGPFGRRPLRAAVEDGWPDSETTAVVARGGSLARISLSDGAVLATVEGAYAERQSYCHGARLGAGFGFICGEPGGATSIYAFERPLSMRLVLRFQKPRFVASSGNGALVVRGPCADEAPGPDTRPYCVVDVSGKAREIRVTGAELGFERVVALRDGRVAVLVPPRAESAGQLTILDGTSLKTVVLRLPAAPKATTRELRRGMWLEGFEEREPGVLGGWVEAGGPIVGVKIALDGAVTAGDVRDDPSGAVLAGRFGLSVGESGRAAESTDGGMTWKLFDLPDRDEDFAPAGTRGCTPVGCAINGWIRVGWGEPKDADDLTPVAPPPSLYIPLRPPSTLTLDCEVAGSVTPPLPAKSQPAPPTPTPTIMLPGRRRGEITPMWLPFRNTPPPTLQSDELGLDNGVPYDLVSMRAYAWGKKGADWTRAGRWMIRFDDRFDLGGGVRSSSASASLWPDEAAAADAMGLTSYGPSWGAYLDPSGRSALIHACKGAGCALFSVSDGQPVLPLRDASGRASSFYRPFPHGAARVGEAWYFLTPGPAYDSVIVWRSDLGVAKQLATFFRPAQARYAVSEPPRLVRRALGGGVGMLVSSAPEPGDRYGSYYVLPMNPDTGELGEAILLGRKDLTGVVPERCAAGQDGWLFDTALDNTPAIELGSGYATLDSVELRLRLDPGMVCVEGMASRMDGTFARAGGAATPSPPASQRDMDAGALPLAATERGTGRRWLFRCNKRGAPRSSP